MSEHGRDKPLIRRQDIKRTAALTASLVAAIHLFHPKLGFPAFILYLSVYIPIAQLPPDPRPFLFVPAGFTIFLGIYLGWTGKREKEIYIYGIVLMLTLFIGYFAWHTLGDHGGFWPGLRATPDPEMNPARYIYLHLIASRTILVSKIAELVTAILLSILLITEVRDVR